MTLKCLIIRAVARKTKIYIEVVQSNLSTKVSHGGLQKWPLFGASETTYPMFTGQTKTDLCGQETTSDRSLHAQVLLYLLFEKQTDVKFKMYPSTYSYPKMTTENTFHILHYQ